MSYLFPVSTAEAVRVLATLPFGEFLDALRVVLLERRRRELLVAELQADTQRAVAPGRQRAVAPGRRRLSGVPLSNAIGVCEDVVALDAANAKAEGRQA